MDRHGDLLAHRKTVGTGSGHAGACPWLPPRRCLDPYRGSCGRAEGLLGERGLRGSKSIETAFVIDEIHFARFVLTEG